MWPEYLADWTVTVSPSVKMVLKNLTVLFATIYLILLPIPTLAVSDPSSSSSESQWKFNNTPGKEQSARPPWNSTWIDLLKKSLLVGYDKFARPSHHLKATNVSVGLEVYHTELDDVTGIMTVHGWIKFLWNDEKLKWNASEYGGLHSIHVADHEIWQPDIVQYNSASGNAVDQYGNTHCIVYEYGQVLWVPPAKLTTFCDMNLKHWPQDEHVCIFRFGSWTYDVVQVNIIDEPNSNASSVLDMTVMSSEWETTHITKTRMSKVYPCCEDTAYISVDFGVHVRRRGGGSIRAALLRTPAAVSALLSLLSHCLPPTSPRLPLAAAPPTLLSVVLLYLANRLPASNQIPNIVMFYSISLYITCLSGIITVIVINMALTRRALPWTIRRILCSRIARCLHLPKIVEHSTSEELQNTIGSGSGSGSGATEEGARMISDSPTPARDWLALAAAIDRIVFIILLLTFVIASIVYCC